MTVRRFNRGRRQARPDRHSLSSSSDAFSRFFPRRRPSSDDAGSNRPVKTHRTVYVVVISLIIDLLAFTMILPLLPSVLDYYRDHDGPDGLFAWFLSKVHVLQENIGAPEHTITVLFGGVLGSMFSFFQFLSSPIFGGLSDVYGRKPIMLMCLVGIAVSHCLWAVSHSFMLFVLARFIGGISKGNVSLSLAIITDVSSQAARGWGMALVGMAFSIGFIIGPMIGGFFSFWAKGQTGEWFIYPAYVAIALSIIDILFVTFAMKESLAKDRRAKSLAKSMNQAMAYINIRDLFRFKAVRNLSRRDAKVVRRLGGVYFVYLFVYSGLEYTLTFLQHYTFDYTTIHQGWMFFGVGVIMAILQGTFVRRIPEKDIPTVAVLGLGLIIPSFFCVGLAAETGYSILLYIGLLFYAVSTAMVVPCMTTLVSVYGAHDQKGTLMGIFRALGSLARALGPVIASLAYWSVGPYMTYLFGSGILLIPYFMLRLQYGEDLP